MLIPSVRAIKAETDRALCRARDPQKLILGYAGFTVLLTSLLSVANALLSNRIAGTGGLANFGIRSVLSTAQSTLPMIQSVILLCLEFGYLHAILRLSRGQYADHTDLKVGFRRFGAIVRLNILQYFLIFSITMVLFYFSMQLFLLTPWADPLLDLLTPLVSTAGTDAAALMDEATMQLALQHMVPMLILYGIICCLVLIPLFFRFRMATYVLLDDPRGKAFAALKTSVRLMKRNGFRLFRLDLGFWWYYLLILLASLVGYGDMILNLMGIPLPFNATVSYFLFFFLYLAMLFAIYYFLRNRVEIAYAKAYDAIRDKPVDDGVVLGNIFDL